MEVGALRRAAVAVHPGACIGNPVNVYAFTQIHHQIALTFASEVTGCPKSADGMRIAHRRWQLELHTDEPMQGQVLQVCKRMRCVQVSGPIVSAAGLQGRTLR